jgi:prepilin-type processing-associated H-X9-DG protein
MTVQDGTSNTIALIEAGPPVLWYKPEDIEFDAKAQLPNMVSPWKDKKVNIGFFDGSVRSGWLDGDEATWKGLITINGNEAVDFSKIEEKK